MYSGLDLHKRDQHHPWVASATNLILWPHNGTRVHRQFASLTELDISKEAIAVVSRHHSPNGTSLLETFVHEEPDSRCLHCELDLT
jgi:hypothetical protein